MARKTASDPITHEMQQELLRTNQALKDAYARFDCVCDSDLIDACIYEINALKARSNYILRCIKARSGQEVPSGIPHAVPVVRGESAPPREDCVAAGKMRGGEICQS